MSNNPRAVFFLAFAVLFVLTMRWAVRFGCFAVSESSGPQASLGQSELNARLGGAQGVGGFKGPAAVALLTACALVIIAFAVLDWRFMADIDSQVNALFVPFRAPWLVQFFVQVTSLGTIISMSTIAIIVSALLWSTGRLPMLRPFWASFVGAEITTWSIKYGVDRARPDFLSGITEANPSFPSGHATASTVVLGFIAFVIARELPNRSQRVEALFWAGVAIAIICFSRLFLSLHYLSDVLAGLLVGSLWLSIGVAMSRWQNLKARTALQVCAGTGR